MVDVLKWTSLFVGIMDGCGHKTGTRSGAAEVDMSLHWHIG